MGREVINVGTTPGDDTGDKLHEGGAKINNMTDEIYAGTWLGATLLQANGGINLGQSDLNHLEEGSNTVTLQGTTTAGSHSYLQNTLYWMRVNNDLFFVLALLVDSIDGAWGGNVEISPLPYPVNNSDHGSVSFSHITRWDFGDYPSLNPTGSKFQVTRQTSSTTGGRDWSNASDFGSGLTVVRLFASGHYRI